MTFHIDAQVSSDADLIEELIHECFGPDRKGRTVYQFRRETAPIQTLGFVARSDSDQMLGSIRFWPVQLEDGRVLPLLGPLAVKPSCQGQGVGRSLITHGLGGAERMGYPGVLIVGKPNYYAPFGFNEALVKDLVLPGPVAPLTFMGLEFSSHPGGMDNLKGLVKPDQSQVRHLAV